MASRKPAELPDTTLKSATGANRTTQQSIYMHTGNDNIYPNFANTGTLKEDGQQQEAQAEAARQSWSMHCPQQCRRCT